MGKCLVLFYISRVWMLADPTAPSARRSANKKGGASHGGTLRRMVG